LQRHRIKEHIIEGLDNAGQGFTDMFQGDVFGKPVIRL
jgi:NADPH-dependent curcumin reductase CurA